MAVDGDIFSTDYINVTDPTPRATVDPDWFDNGPLDVGAKAGIAAGGVVFILIIAGCCVVWRGKRRRRAFLRNYEARQGNRKGWPSPLVTSGMKEVSDTPLSQKPLRNWNDSPQSSQSEQHFPRYFSPYSSQFNSPVSASDGQQPQWPPLNPQQQMQQQAMNHNIGLALGGDDSSVDNGAKGKERQESYEMHHVDPGYNGEDHFSSPSSDQQSYFTHGHGRTYSGSYRNFSARRESGM